MIKLLLLLLFKQLHILKGPIHRKIKQKLNKHTHIF